MTIESVPYHLIDPNPYQPRIELTDLEDLAAEIRQHGLLQKPKARPTPDGRFQLSYGHRRHAAWALASPGQPMPLEVEDMTDRQMAEFAAVENDHRPLTAIEKAISIQRYQKEFGMTQLEAGALFGLKTQSAVSNLLRLLKLPEPMQAHLNTGALPERLARMLIPIARIFPKEATRIAGHIANVEPNDKQATCEEGIEDLLSKRGRRMWHVIWKDGWPKEPMSTDILGGHPSLSTVPACEGCEFHFDRNEAQLCARPECFDAKTEMWVRLNELPGVSKKLGIPVAQPKEQTQIVYAGHNYGQQDLERQGKLALQTRHASLRLVPYRSEHEYGSQESSRQMLLGSKHVALASTDLKALKKAIAEITPKARAKADKPKLTWQERMKIRLAKEKDRLTQCEALVERVAPAFARVLPANARTLDFLAQLLSGTVIDYQLTQLQEKVLKAKTPAQKQITFARMLLDEAIAHGELDEARTWIDERARQLKLALPRGWDAAPSADSHQKPAPAKKAARKK